jgi:hypothetical protein
MDSSVFSLFLPMLIFWLPTYALDQFPGDTNFWLTILKLIYSFSLANQFQQ